MSGWTMQAGASGAALTNYPLVVDLNFVKRLNALGYWSTTLASANGAGPTSYDVARLVWDLGGSDERVHFEGVITEAKRLDGSNMKTYRGLSLEGLLWMAKQGDIRTYKNRTPHSIIQGGGTPGDLLTNMQGNQIMAYGTSASVPNKVDGANPGVSMSFRSDAEAALVNIQRLALQSQYSSSTVPPNNIPALEAGLEFFCRLEGANNSTPTFYLVRRREQSPAPAETWFVNQNLFKSRRGFEGITGAQAIKTIGSGSGQAQVASSIIGSGGIEGIVSDKTLIGLQNNAGAGYTNANVMVRRLAELMDPATEVVTGITPKHVFTSDPGDSVTISESGQPNTSLRLFSVAYRLKHKAFSLTFGRPRVLQQDGWLQLNNFAAGHGTGTQIMDSTKVANTEVNDTRAGIIDGDPTPESTLTFLTPFEASLHEALSLKWAVQSDQAGDYRILVKLPATANAVLDLPLTLRANTQAAGDVYIPAARIRDDLLVTGQIANAGIQVINHSGATADITQRLWGWLQS